MRKAVIDISGKRFGRLTVVRFVPRSERTITNAVWECLCDCGKIKKVDSFKLRAGNTKSCGCWLTDARKTHGFASRKGKRSPEYAAFWRAQHRCQNPLNDRFPDYGGRGIRFLFSSPQDIIDEIGLRPSLGYSLDRINNDGNYEKGNIRWATQLEQNRNRRPRRWRVRPASYYAERLLELTNSKQEIVGQSDPEAPISGDAS